MEGSACETAHLHLTSKGQRINRDVELQQPDCRVSRSLKSLLLLCDTYTDASTAAQHSAKVRHDMYIT